MQLTELLEACPGLQQDAPDVVDGPGVQLPEGHLQQHAVEGRDQVHVLQAVTQRLSGTQDATLQDVITRLWRLLDSGWSITAFYGLLFLKSGPLQ